MNTDTAAAAADDNDDDDDDVYLCTERQQHSRFVRTPGCLMYAIHHHARFIFNKIAWKCTHVYVPGLKLNTQWIAINAEDVVYGESLKCPKSIFAITLANMDLF